MVITKPHGTTNVYKRLNKHISILKNIKNKKDADSSSGEEGHKMWLTATETQSEWSVLRFVFVKLQFSRSIITL